MIATILGALPLLAFGGWRLWSVLQQEDGAGINAMDRLQMHLGSIGQESRMPSPASAPSPLRLVTAMVVVVAVLAVGVFMLSKSGSSSNGGGQAKASVAATAALGAPTAVPVVAATPRVEVRKVAGPYDVQVQALTNFAWPTVGILSGFFERGDPRGITIALDRVAEVEVYASYRGVVSFAGGDGCCGNGMYVEIDHEDDWSSLYANLSQFVVAKGQHVEKGDVIGYGGLSGSVQRKQLHFELRIAGEPVDPLLYLPASGLGLEQQSLRTVSCPSAAIPVDANSTQNVLFYGDSLERYIIESVVIDSTDPAAPEIASRQVGAHSLSLAVPAAAVVSPTGTNYTLSLVMTRGDDRIAIECGVQLRTANTMPPGSPPKRQEPIGAAPPIDFDSGGTVDANERPNPSPTPRSSAPQRRDACRHQEHACSRSDAGAEQAGDYEAVRPRWQAHADSLPQEVRRIGPARTGWILACRKRGCNTPALLPSRLGPILIREHPRAIGAFPLDHRLEPSQSILMHPGQASLAVGGFIA